MRSTPEAIRATKQAVTDVRNRAMTPRSTICRRVHRAALLRSGEGRDKGLSQFLDDKTYRPGIGPLRAADEKTS